MCGKFTALTWDEALQVTRNIEMNTPVNIEPDWPARQSFAFPKSKAVIIVAGGHTSFAPQELIWGFTMPNTSQVAFNTRIENADTSSFWHESFIRRRCIVPAFAFYEPHRSEMALGPSGKQIKQAYRFVCEHNLPLLMAGIWQDDRFSLMTTKPNSFVSPVHDRMPIVFTTTEAKRWLQGGDIDSSFVPSQKLASQPVYPDTPEQSQLALF